MNAAPDRWADTPKPPVLSGISGALAKAQCEMHNPKFDTQNPFFKNRYASLAAVRDAVVPVLAKHGIALTQDIVATEKGVAVTTTLRHESGESLTFGPFELPAQKMDAQGYGSCATYARRYHMMAVAGVVGDSDDDGEAAVGRSGPQGLPDINPRGEEKYEDTAKAKVMAAKCREALKVGIDEAVWELHDECNKDSVFYIAVSGFLNAAERREWKEIVKRRHGTANPAAG